jgi:hypothetical protein
MEKDKIENKNKNAAVNKRKSVNIKNHNNKRL